MKLALLPIIVLGFAAGCDQAQPSGKSGMSGSSVPAPTSSDIEKLKNGDHDAGLVGKWKGVSATETGLLFLADGTMESLLYDQTNNKGYWRTENGNLYFLFMWQDDPEWHVQSSSYAFDRKGNVSFSPDQFGGSNSGGYRSIVPPQDRDTGE